MRNQEEYNFLKSMSFENVNYFRRIVTDCVMATDLAKSMTWLSTARHALVKSDSHSTSADDEKKVLENKILRLQLLMKCGDVGHPARPLELHLEWSKRICEEFYSQGDLERVRGMKISPLCDRNIPSSSYPQGQIGFINFVSKPVFALLSAVCNSSVKEEDKPWLKHLDANIQYWESKIIPINENTKADERKQSTAKTISLDFLKSYRNLPVESSEKLHEVIENVEASSSEKKNSTKFSNISILNEMKVGAENKILKSTSIVMHLCFVSAFIFLHT